ncbi:hypothetical protein AJ79_02339 [Helicocarpus griseus UAMH5409]|uniref:N-acetyltransferase domain-containing protein n=1 Tax=Helicocarpus griseus UAMH5409 TaxID=1447875 RepID=A0A2B7Y4F8_9EURO|nr:hypothetical protein AJ79_02339 [Helicocarpus griseus UAMH5409]
MDPSSDFRATILDAKQFAAYPHLDSLMSMINEAYTIRHREAFATDKGSRFNTLKELIDALEDGGRCCIVTQEQQKNPAPTIVACAMLNVFHEGDPVSIQPTLSTEDGDGTGRSSTSNGANGTSSEPSGSLGTTESGLTPAAPLAGVKDGHVDITSVFDWELGVVAVRHDPRFAKLGLATRCASLLEQDLLDRLDMAEKGKAVVEGTAGKQPLTCWVKTTGIANRQYWKRRGFNDVRLKKFPPGFWGAFEEFELVWMKRDIPRRKISGCS